MKTFAYIASLFFSIMTFSQTPQINPQISVQGEGKVKVTPDQAIISVAVENTGKEASEVKKLNDASVDAVLKYIKKMNIAAYDYQTQQVNLHKNYDYQTKKYSYVANQTISIRLKDLARYDELMIGLMDSGINTINGIEFKNSKIEEYEKQARKQAMQNAIQKANDYISVIPNQKVGKAISISDNSQTHYPPIYANMRTMATEASVAGAQETLAIGEITVVSTVSVTFALD